MSIKTVEEFNTKIKRVLISEEEIREATKKVGKEISESYDGHPILLVSILKGAFVFMADCVVKLQYHVRLVSCVRRVIIVELFLQER